MLLYYILTGKAYDILFIVGPNNKQVTVILMHNNSEIGPNWKAQFLVVPIQPINDNYALSLFVGENVVTLLRMTKKAKKNQ